MVREYRVGIANKDMLIADTVDIGNKTCGERVDKDDDDIKAPFTPFEGVHGKPVFMNDPKDWVATVKPRAGNCGPTTITSCLGRPTYLSDATYSKYVNYVWALIKRHEVTSRVMRQETKGRFIIIPDTHA